MFDGLPRLAQRWAAATLRYLFAAAAVVTVSLSLGCASRETSATSNPVSPKTPPALSYPATPQVVVETGVHGAVIWRVDVDRAGRLLVSGSDDATVRVWAVPSGELLRTIRVPRAGGNVGRIYAVAIAPDGQVIAAGGFTSPDDQPQQIYLFDQASGILTRRIDGLDNTVQDLAFSPDGRFLAAVLGGRSGLRVYRVADGLEVGRDDSYDGSSYGVAFAPDGRLATVADDSFVRLYEPGFQRIAKVEAPGGNEPFEVAFSPDGSEVAVGYNDTTRVDVLSVPDLRLAHLPDIEGVDNGDLSKVAWSVDGHRLCAAGRFGRAGEYPIRCWSQRGRGPAVEHAVGADNTIMDLAPLPDGGLAVGVGPLLAVTAADGTVRWSHRGEQADFRGQRGDRSLRVAADGAVVAFGFEQWGERPARLDLRQGRLELDPPPDPALTGARTSAPGLEVEDWEDQHTPRLGGRELALERNETARSLAIAPDGSRFVLGTEFRLRAYNRDGGQFWHVETGAVAWSVTIADDGRTLVAGLDDGTLRWYDLSDGRELAAAFVHPDGRWVAWLPEGFFAASKGGAELIGYHLNRGLDAPPAFLRLEQLFERFYRPELVLARLARDEAPIQLAVAQSGDLEALLAGAEVPALALLGPAEQTVSGRDYLVEVAVEDRGNRSSPIDALEIRVNGTKLAAAGSRAKPRRLGDGRIALGQPVVLAPGPNVIEVATPADARGIASAPVRQVVVVEEPALAPPTLRGLAIGIDGYYDAALGLKYAVGDATAVKEVLERQARHLFAAIDIQLLPDGAATKAGIGRAFRELAARTQPQDVFVLYLAGHGFAQDGRYHFVPQEVAYTNQETLQAGSLSEADLVALLQIIPAQKSLVVLDTCYAGAFNAPQQLAMLGTRGLEEKAAIDRLMRATGRAVLAASTDQQLALEGYQGHGLFSFALLEGLAGSADEKAGDDNGFVSVDELASYVQQRVPALSYEAFQRYQIPMRSLIGQTFDISQKSSP